MKLWINGIFYHLFLIVSLKSGALLIQLLMQARADHNFSLMRNYAKESSNGAKLARDCWLELALYVSIYLLMPARTRTIKFLVLISEYLFYTIS
jgi:hypothetical protein